MQQCRTIVSAAVQFPYEGLGRRIRREAWPPRFALGFSPTALRETETIGRKVGSTMHDAAPNEETI